MSRPSLRPPSGADHRRGAVMGLTMAEAFVLIAFALLLLMGAWKVQADAAQARFEPARAMTPPQVEAAARLAATGQIEAADALVASGADLRDADPWRLIDRDELRRIVQGVEALPEEVQRDLADLVEIEDGAALVQLLSETERAGPEARLAAIGARLDGARAARASLVGSLRDALGPTVGAVGGTIEADGSIVLPDSVLFESGSARITPVMDGFLAEACEPWLRTLRGSGAPVSRAQIEGHASSEWRTGASPDEAYLNNLSLSQARSQAVLNACLGLVTDAELRLWAQGRLAAIGYSSARPALVDGVEDPERSRRVVFSVALDDAGLLREVEDGLE